VPRRVTVPAADDIFRPTAVPDPEPDPEPASETGTGDDTAAGDAARRVPSGRIRHDEKMTVYVTSDELLEIEHARLTLRRRLGRGVDRGRIVRAAVALALADLDEHGDESQLVHRLRQQA
jgi:hypothetical protein